MKILTGKAIGRELERHIRYSTKAPKNWTQRREAMRKTGTDIASDLKKRGVKLPWGLIFIAGAFITAIILFLFFRGEKGFGEGRGGITPGERPGEPVDLKGKDVRELLDDFGYEPEGGQGDGRPFE